MLIGVPVIMLMTSVFCVRVVTPPWCPSVPEISGRYILNSGCITEINDLIDGLPFKKKYQLQSCVEECVLRILSESSCQNLWLTVYISDSFSLSMEYDGKRCNPLRQIPGEDEIGLALIKYRALRARHRYFRKINYLHIVL
jgi:hypothetical protein